MSLIKQFEEQARVSSGRIVFPEGDDIRILEAARYLVDNDIAKATLLGNADEIIAVAEKARITIDGIECINPQISEQLESYAELYALGRPKTKPAIASRIVRKPLHFGAMMVKAQDADLVVAGVAHSTRRVIEAASACIGLASASSIPSSYFIMRFKDRSPLIFADCAVNVDPNADELADIAIKTAISAQHLLSDPVRVALLSFSTNGSADHPRVDKVKQALRIVQKNAPDLLVDGELQADSALVSAIAAQKGVDSSEVAGSANVLIFPDLDAGNISYKLVQHLAGAQAVGPFLQGFARPVADLSRGASVQDIISISTIALAVQ